ncbi:Vacuolar protein sorting-associated protein 37B [Mizuhopecten yessoensis]|uniref:Vacuolar protein sorting-associated protein 37B n=1 Tax=Mizuhopecten yessoensis TaxID=6573 RepID=A0A210PTC6_MIZYE|nr:Vacuolar protein sorting-associated protein 37B [Mizuhopecten yessoensis]
MYGHFTSGQVSGSSSPRSEAPNLKSDEAAAVKNIQTEREMLMTQNRSVAEYNISLRPKLESLKTKLATNYEEASSLKTTLAMDKSKLDALRGELSLDTVSVLLQTATAKTEEDAEEISDQFFDRKMDVETYLEQYLNKRTLSHLQLVKSQKLNELIRAQHSQAQQSNQQTSYNWGSGSQGGSYPAPPPIAQPGSGVPYPSGYPYHTGGAFQMPQTEKRKELQIFWRIAGDLRIFFS